MANPLGIPWPIPSLCLGYAQYLTFVVRVTMLNKASRGIVHRSEIHHRDRRIVLQCGTQQYKHQAPQQQQIHAIEPRFVHLEPISRLLSRERLGGPPPTSQL